MSPDDPVDLDPEVLRDPVDDGASPPAPPAPGEVAPPSEALVRAGDSSLASYDPFRRYMAEIKKYPPLTREEEVELARLYRDTGDRDALFRLITANLMLVVHVAFSFRRAARNLLDLIQEGNVGLLRAVERFDPELGVRLPTYAAWWVRAFMIKFMLDNVRLVRVGTTNARRKLLRNLQKEKLELERQGFEVGPKLLAEHFGVSENDVIDVQAALESRDVSLDEPVAAEGERPQAELLAAPEQASVEDDLARRELQAQAETALAKFRTDLGARDLLLLDQRILSDAPMTLQAVGDRFGTTREAVRQAESRLRKRLADFLREELGDGGQVRVG